MNITNSKPQFVFKGRIYLYCCLNKKIVQNVNEYLTIFSKFDFCELKRIKKNGLKILREKMLRNNTSFGDQHPMIFDHVFS